MFTIGCHLSSSKGFLHMGKEAISLGANTFQFFTRNPRGFSSKEPDPADCEAFIKYWSENNGGKIVAHAPYTLNACSAEEKTRELAYMIMSDDLKRMELVPDNYYNFHPGSHVKQGVEKGTDYIVELLNRVITPEQKTIVLLETMAGKGSEIGRTFEEIQAIIERVELKDKIGVCMDTCHVFDGGYDIINKLDSVFEEFDRIIGLNKLYAVHINDSKNVMGSHKDRHECIGKGNIGIEAFERFVNHKAVQGLPMILETPNDLPGYKQEIELLKGLYKE
ncbi:MAG: deoxyribonuclease IV [Acutalibacteraceae bacterium]|nr:deoxyribonuclease IV [Clostridia bacterium]MEE3450104.1 deoxyribonuclease IV [Acutalibacteraceae bacterium]